MQRAIGLLLIILGVWAAIEVSQHGTAGAFGGLFVRLGLEAPPAPGTDLRGPAERAADRLRSAYQAGMDRGDRPERYEAGDRTDD